MSKKDKATDILYGHNIVAITLSKDKTTLDFMETCDFYYEAKLTKVEVASLIEELQSFYNQMKEL